MPYFMVQASYTGEAWGAQIKNPTNRIEQLKPIVASLGGTLEAAYYTFGEYDIMGIAEFPDNQSAAAFSLAASAAGSVNSVRTTPLLTAEEGIEAMRKAGGSSYKPPGG